MIECFLSAIQRSLSSDSEEVESTLPDCGTRDGSCSDKPHVLDLVDMVCPLPVLKLKQLLVTVGPLDKVRVSFTDRASLLEFMKLDVKILAIDTRCHPFEVVLQAAPASQKNGGGSC